MDEPIVEIKFSPNGWVRYVGPVGTTVIPLFEYHDDDDVAMLPYRIDQLIGQVRMLSNRRKPPRWLQGRLAVWADELEQLRQEAASKDATK